MVSMLNRVTLAIARHGDAVILGRGSFVLLTGLAGVLNVRVKAPLEARIDRVMREEGIADRSHATQAVREEDKVRSAFVSTVYGVRWDSMEKFDLVIDTGRIPIALAASWIAEAIQGIEDTGPLGAGTEADPVLDDAVATELGCAKRHAVLVR